MAFFKKRLQIMTPEKSALVRMEKTFQPLLRNLDVLRGHLSMLEKDFR